MEVHNKDLVGMLNTNGPCLSAVGNLVDDINAWKPLFRLPKFSFINHICNKVAKALATEILS